MPDINYGLAALGAVADSPYTSGGFTPGQAIDGNDLTKWEYDYGSSSVNSYIRVDLGAPQYITSVRTLQQNSVSMSWGLQYSFDNVTWNTIVPQATRADGDYTTQTGGVTARYWRCLVGSVFGGKFSLHAFDIIGPSEAPPPPANTNCEDMQAWLDGLEAYWVPCVQTWLDAN